MQTYSAVAAQVFDLNSLIVCTHQTILFNSLTSGDSRPGGT